MIMVPYWRIRNSWGDTYASGGNYNHAMYPFNKVSQIDKTVTITDPSTNTTMRVGGCVTFEPDTVETSTLEKNNGKGMGSAGVVETSSSDVNTGLFPGKDSSTGSSSNTSSSGKIAYAPLYGNPPETTIPLYVQTNPTTTSAPYFEPPTSTPPPAVSRPSRTKRRALILWISIGVLGCLVFAGGSFLLYWYRDKIRSLFSPYRIVPYQSQPASTPFQPTPPPAGWYGTTGGWYGTAGTVGAGTAGIVGAGGWNGAGTVGTVGAGTVGTVGAGGWNGTGTVGGVGGVGGTGSVGGVGTAAAGNW
jgi:hypothetical protein